MVCEGLAALDIVQRRRVILEVEDFALFQRGLVLYTGSDGRMTNAPEKGAIPAAVAEEPRLFPGPVTCQLLIEAYEVE